MEKPGLIHCPGCDTAHVPGCFYNSKDRANGKSCYCKSCDLKRQQARYDSGRGKKKARQFKIWERNKAFVIDYKDRHPCKCGETRHYVLDFHHRDPEEKEYMISRMLRDASIQRLAAEMYKCDVMCSNCHRAHHWAEGNEGYASPSTQTI